jgi:predicted transposase/invertase (TIGR01784 family)
LLKFVKTDTELVTDLDRWLYVLKNMSRMDKIPVYLRKPIFEKLFSIAEYTNLTKEEKTMYDSSMKYKWDNKNVRDYEVAEAKKEGKLEGEQKKALDIAGKLKKEGLSIEFIVETTGLTIEEIKKL